MHIQDRATILSKTRCFYAASARFIERWVYPNTEMASVIKVLIFAVSVLIPAKLVFANPADCPGDKSGPEPKLFERTERTTKPIGALEAPAAVARWINDRAKKQVSVSVTVAR